jgi:LPS O-antigen subunit length determinant protein (WzzB/FepE family)
MNQQPLQPQYFEEESIDLRELLTTLAKRKILIAGVTFLITAAAAVYAFLAKPVYEVKSIIEMAQIDKKVVQQPEDLRQKLEFIYEVGIKGKKVGFPAISSVSVPRKSSNLIEVRAQGYSNESAKKKLQEVVDYVVGSQVQEIAGFIQIQQEKSAMMKQDIARKEKVVADAENRLKNYEEKLMSLSKGDSTLAGVYAIGIGSKQTEINELKDKIYELRDRLNDLTLSVSPLMIQSAKMVGNIELLDKPVKPKKRLIIAVAFVTGLMLSVFLAFFLAFIDNAKREEKAPAEE